MGYELTLDFPPSANRYWRNYRGRMVRSKEADHYKEAVGKRCKASGIKPLEGPVALSLTFFRPARRGDLDNRIKICLDSLNGWAYHDDKQVVEIHARWDNDKHHPRVEVTISEPSS